MPKSQATQAHVTRKGCKQEQLWRENHNDKPVRVRRILVDLDQ